MMHGREKSDFAIVAVKLANKAERSAAEQSAAESVERRAETKGNVDQPRAREGECELGTLAIGKRCQERISATGWAW
jgi:hypothetical protein